MANYRLDQVSLGEIIRDLYLQRVTGALHVEPVESLPLSFIFREGQLAQVLPQDPDHRWGQWLVKKHLISPWDLELALTQVRPRHPIGQALTSLGLLSEEEVQAALQEWAFEHWQCALQNTRGTCRFQNQEDSKTSGPVLTRDVGDWLARAIRALPDQFPFGHYLDTRRFSVVREPGRKIPDVRLYKAEKMLLETLAEGRTLEEVARFYRMPAKTVERAAYLFTVLNWLEPAAEETTEVTDDLEIYEKILTTTGIHELLNPTKIPTVDEVKGLASRLPNLNFYEILGLEPHASNKEIVDAYYQVSHRYTPHLLAKIYGPDPDLLQAAERLSEAIDRAYRILRDPDKRRKYHENLGLPVESLEEDEPAIQHAKTAYKIYMNARKAMLGGQYVEASRLLAKAVRMKPDQAMYWERLGDAYMRLKKYKEAVDAYQKAWKHQPYNLDVAVALARLYWQFQKPALAARWAREALNIDPDNPQVRKFLEQMEGTKKGREKSGSLLGRLRKKK